MTAPHGCETVLLVEDDAGVRSLAERLWLAHGDHVLEASGPGAALDLDACSAATIHLLLTDVVRPTMGGVELAGSLRSHRPVRRVLLFPGYATDVLAGQAETLAETLLAKPFTALELLRAVRQQLGQASASRRPRD